MTEKGDAQQLLELLKPTVETNQATLLVGNRVEVGKIQGNKKVGRERGKEREKKERRRQGETGGTKTKRKM